jgi:hypothetical protein
MRSVRAELPSALACAQAALRLERSVSVSVQRARPSAPAYAQAAQPWAAVAVPDARAARRPVGAASDAQEPQRAAEAEVSVEAAGLQPAAVAGLGAAAGQRPAAAGGRARRRAAAGRRRRWGGTRRRSCCRRRRRRACRRCGRRRAPGALRFSVGTELLRRLRDDDRRSLRMRCRTGELHHRQRGRGKQHETKVYHGGGPRKGSWRRDERIAGAEFSAGRSTASR